MARGIADARRSLFPGRSGPMETVSSMYKSHFPWSYAGISTIVCAALANGVSCGNTDGDGIMDWIGALILVGSHSFYHFITKNSVGSQSFYCFITQTVVWVFFLLY